MSCTVLDRTRERLQRLDRRHHSHVAGAREHHQCRFYLQDGDTAAALERDLVARLRERGRSPAVDQQRHIAVIGRDQLARPQNARASRIGAPVGAQSRH
jgi:hypothetical protein